MTYVITLKAGFEFRTTVEAERRDDAIQLARAYARACYPDRQRWSLVAVNTAANESDPRKAGRSDAPKG